MKPWTKVSGPHGSHNGKEAALPPPRFPARSAFHATVKQRVAQYFVARHLATTGDLSDAGLRRGIAYGTVIASFTVQDFGLRRLCRVEPQEIEARFEELRQLAHFDRAPQ